MANPTKRYQALRIAKGEPIGTHVKVGASARRLWTKDFVDKGHSIWWEWRANLKTLICSAGRGNRENLDSVAPHIVVLAHLTGDVIGVGDIEKTIQEAVERAEDRYWDRVAIG
ncbi:hypothetical protein BKA70DRAFT_1229625 [Coprinopsis sp. MPI-PUGE-AT-0042]|nr:hypothetical protein BKA70DRAFT_1229625 [Coprinopsis sp. MPI-PUGE-AT-0042]